MTRLFLFGAGRVGSTIADLLAGSGDYELTVADRAGEALAACAGAGYRTLQLASDDDASLRLAIAGHAMLVNAGPFHLSTRLAVLARTAGIHYFDLTEDVGASQMIRAMAAGATSVLMPQCGLAPGFVGIVAHELAQRFDQLRDLQLRVGALPRYPNNALKYNLTWSTEGLINEYCNPCDAIVDGRPQKVAPLDGLEHLVIEGTAYEAFNTSGGLGGLCEALAGRVANLDYKSIRYPGHRDVFHLLLDELQLRHRRSLLRDILEQAVPTTMQDVVLILVKAIGQRQGRFSEVNFFRRIHGRPVAGQPRGAIQLTAAAAACVAVDLVRSGQLPQAGFVGQEQIALADFLANRFGVYYRADEAASEPS